MSTGAANPLPPGVRLDNLRPVSLAHERAVIELASLNQPPGIWAPDFQWPTYEDYVEREARASVTLHGLFFEADPRDPHAKYQLEPDFSFEGNPINQITR